MTQILKPLRLEKGWSQEQLADIAGVSSRTIQRIENGEACSLDTAQSLAAAFNTKPDIFLKPPAGEDEKDLLTRVRLERTVRQRLGFYGHLAVYLAVNTLLAVINLTTFPGHLWFLYPLAGWGIGVIADAVMTFGGDDLEGRMVRKMMKKEREKTGV